MEEEKLRSLNTLLNNPITLTSFNCTLHIPTCTKGITLVKLIPSYYNFQRECKREKHINASGYQQYDF